MSATYNAAAVGMFDGVHRGHRDIMHTILSEAEALGGHPVVLTFAGHPLSVLRPSDAPCLLTTPAEKETLIRDFMPTADVRLLDFKAMHGVQAREFLLRLRDGLDVRTMVMGYDNRFGCDGPREREAYDRLGRELGVRVVHVEPRTVDGTTASSSEIRRLLLAGRVDIAADMLGRLYGVSGTVGHGRELGRTIGFPTANLVPDALKLVPAGGVYAARATVEGLGTWPAMVNIGRRPTVESSGSAPVTIEAHLIGADADMYGRRMTLAFVSRLRDERAFPSLDALCRQLEADRRNTLITLDNGNNNLR
ncbi:MAG: riboflavin biosynthesis protein RibF [Muribaculaceae bacterium]|nr:riboflavin biosynthesis protein RibF [Muribaculaceae bacterium]